MAPQIHCWDQQIVVFYNYRADIGQKMYNSYGVCYHKSRTSGSTININVELIIMMRPILYISSCFV